MKLRLILGTLLIALANQGAAEMVVRKVPYELDGRRFEGMLVYDDAVKQTRPGLLMVPNWMGPTEQAAEKAKRVAGQRYLVFVADMYGANIRPKNPEEAAQAAGQVRQDRALMRQRAQRALDVLREEGRAHGLDSAKLGAIGFCFGGGTVLELARSGAQVAGVVSFHGNLDTPNPADAKNIKAKVLVLHGADDPYVPPAQVEEFTQEMRQAGVDWQLMMFGNAVHSFTDPTAKSPGQAEYNPLVAQRAFGMMNAFFDEAFEGK